MVSTKVNNPKADQEAGHSGKLGHAGSGGRASTRPQRLGNCLTTGAKPLELVNVYHLFESCPDREGEQGMKSHVWRPLWVFLAIVAVILLARVFLVPEDFGVHETGYMYGWYREGNVQEWKDPQPKYLGAVYCAECHEEKTTGRDASPHGAIQCENCHGPALGHPDDPPALAIDRSRELCLRCHAWLPYPTSGRMAIPGIDPQSHNPGEECSSCHDPHHPNLEEM